MTCFDKEGCRMFHVVGAECLCMEKLKKQLEQLRMEDPLKWFEVTGNDVFNQPHQPAPPPQPVIGYPWTVATLSHDISSSDPHIAWIGDGTVCDDISSSFIHMSDSVSSNNAITITYSSIDYDNNCKIVN